MSLPKVSLPPTPGIVWMTLGVIAAPNLALILAPVWVGVLVGAVGIACIFAWMLYWHRARVDPLVRAAQQPGKPTPWVEITWPRWQIRAAKGYAVLLACMFALLLVVLLITAFTERF